MKWGTRTKLKVENTIRDHTPPTGQIKTTQNTRNRLNILCCVRDSFVRRQYQKKFQMK